MQHFIFLNLSKLIGNNKFPAIVLEISRQLYIIVGLLNYTFVGHETLMESGNTSLKQLGNFRSFEPPPPTSDYVPCHLSPVTNLNSNSHSQRSSPC